MKTLDPQRSRAIQCYFLSILFMVVFFVANHIKASMGVVVPCALAACFFALLGLRARVNLTDEPYR